MAHAAFPGHYRAGPLRAGNPNAIDFTPILKRTHPHVNTHLQPINN